MTYSEWQHALQVLAEERVGGGIRAAGQAEEAAAARSRQALSN